MYHVDVLLLPLKNYDMILGSQWLAQSGDVVTNFTELYFKFYNGNDICTIKWKKSDSIDLFGSVRLDKLLRKYNAVASIAYCGQTIRLDIATSSSPLHIVVN